MGSYRSAPCALVAAVLMSHGSALATPGLPPTPPPPPSPIVVSCPDECHASVDATFYKQVPGWATAYLGDAATWGLATAADVQATAAGIPGQLDPIWTSALGSAEDQTDGAITSAEPSVDAAETAMDAASAASDPGPTQADTLAPSEADSATDQSPAAYDYDSTDSFVSIGAKPSGGATVYSGEDSADVGSQDVGPIGSGPPPGLQAVALPQGGLVAVTTPTGATPRIDVTLNGLSRIVSTSASTIELITHDRRWFVTALALSPSGTATPAHLTWDENTAHATLPVAAAPTARVMLGVVPRSLTGGTAPRPSCNYNVMSRFLQFGINTTEVLGHPVVSWGLNLNGTGLDVAAADGATSWLGSGTTIVNGERIHGNPKTPTVKGIGGVYHASLAVLNPGKNGRARYLQYGHLFQLYASLVAKGPYGALHAYDVTYCIVKRDTRPTSPDPGASE
jgi:hypothetical protein